MLTKLTLTIEKEVIDKAKVYAKSTGRSLSELIETYLESILSVEDKRTGISSKLKKIVGSVQLPPDFDEKKELEAYFHKKHL